MIIIWKCETFNTNLSVRTYVYLYNVKILFLRESHKLTINNVCILIRSLGPTIYFIISCSICLHFESYFTYDSAWKGSPSP